MIQRVLSHLLVLVNCITLQNQFLKGVRYKDVQDWLRGESTYTLHKPIRRRFKRRKTIVGGIDYQWQADLADMQHLAKQNNNKKYLLCVIDVFSKFSGLFLVKIKWEKL